MKTLFLLNLICFSTIVTKASASDTIDLTIIYAQLNEFNHVLSNGECENAVIVKYEVTTNTATRDFPVKISFGGIYQQLSPSRSTNIQWEAPERVFSNNNPTITENWSTGNLNLSCATVRSGSIWKWIMEKFKATQGTKETVPPLPSSALVDCK